MYGFENVMKCLEIRSYKSSINLSDLVAYHNKLGSSFFQYIYSHSTEPENVMEEVTTRKS